jgi:predicted ATP-binding protein involved in virulence
VKLARIGIENLFGQFDYDIPLNREDRITILAGPNGCGKTTLLDTTWRLFSGKPLSVPCSRRSVSSRQDEHNLFLF